MYMTYTDFTHPLSTWVSDQVYWNVPSWQASNPPGLVPNVMVVLGLGMGVRADDADTDFKSIASGGLGSGDKRHIPGLGQRLSGILHTTRP